MTETLTVAGLAARIDHTLLRPDATEAEMAAHCQQAARYGFATVAINTAWVAFCARQLAGAGVGVCAAVGFPLGQMPTAVKLYEASYALEHGATEIDWVLPVGQLKSGGEELVGAEIKALVELCGRRVSKLILETCYLTDAEKQLACDLAIAAGATFVKTSTGFGPRGAIMPDVLLLVSQARGRIQVKASGGIRTLEAALGYLDAGATRLGVSQSVAILEEAREVLPA